MAENDLKVILKAKELAELNKGLPLEDVFKK